MTRRDLWRLVLLALAVVLFLRLFPRYEWRSTQVEGRYSGLVWVRIDRWTGRATLQNFAWGYDLPVATRD